MLLIANETKIQNSHNSMFVHNQIGRFDVSVNKTMRMCVSKSGGQLQQIFAAAGVRWRAP